MRPVLVLLLAGCSSSHIDYDLASGRNLPTLLGRLRAVAGDVSVISGDRYYVVRAGTLDAQLHAFAGAVADAIEATAAPGSTLGFGEDVASPVHAYSWLDRGLDAKGVLVECIRTDAGTRYCVTVDLGPDRFLYALADGTAEAEVEWTRLIDGVRKLAVQGVDGGPTVAGGSSYFRWGNDLR